jgi:phage gp36-like protein
MAAPLITKEQLEARVGATQLHRCCDDNNDGQGDKVVIDQLLADASGYVRGGMPQHDPDDLTPTNALVTDELRRLALDAAVLMLAERRPTIIKRNVERMREALETSLDRLMKGQRTLGSNTAPAPADHSVSVVSTGTLPSGGSYWP